MRMELFKTINLKLPRKWIGYGLGLVVMLGVLYLGFNWLISPKPDWDDGDKWQVKVYQRADHIKHNDPPWLLVNELEMTLTHQILGDNLWHLEVYDRNGCELFPGIQKLTVNYSDDLQIIGGSTFNADNQPDIALNEFWECSLYSLEFFDISSSQKQLSGHRLTQPNSVILNQEKGRSCVWEKGHPWWTSYQSEQPPIKAELVPLD